MNIFYLDKDPTMAAQAMVDSHVVKMILESCQLLSTAWRVIDGSQGTDKRWLVDPPFAFLNDRIYKATHINHPSAIWVREAIPNYRWLHDHLLALLDEYTFRYGKTHASTPVALNLQMVPSHLKGWEPTPVRCAMPVEYQTSDDPVANYRDYYRVGKAHLHKWTKRPPPDWI